MELVIWGLLIGVVGIVWFLAAAAFDGKGPSHRGVRPSEHRSAAP